MSNGAKNTSHYLKKELGLLPCQIKLGRKPLSHSNRRSQRVMSRITQPEYLALELAVAQFNDRLPSGSPTVTTSKFIQMCIQNNKFVKQNLRGDK